MGDIQMDDGVVEGKASEQLLKRKTRKEQAESVSHADSG